MHLHWTVTIEPVMMLLMTGILLVLIAAAPTWATSYVRVPQTTRGQLELAATSGEFRLGSPATMILEDGFAVTHVSATPTTGGGASVRLILPGGIVNGKFDRVIPDGFQVFEGETVYLRLEHSLALAGHYNLSGQLELGLVRRVDTRYGPRAVTPSGRIIADVPCDAALTFVVDGRTWETLDTDEEGLPAVVAYPDNYVVVDEPIAYGADWNDVILGFASCGGGR